MEFREKLAKVAEYKKATNKLLGKYPYFKIEEYTERMNSVFGREGYEASYSMLPPVILPNGQVFLQCLCHMDIYHEGKKQLSVEGIGSKEIPTNDNGTFILLNNISHDVQFSAFKSACRELHIFGKGLEDEETDEGSTGNGSSQKESGARPQKEVKKLTFYVKDKLQEVRKDRRTEKAVYRMTAHLVSPDGKSCHEKQSEVLLYPNVYEKNANRMNQLLTMDERGMKISMEVTCLEPGKGFEGTYALKAFL